MASLFRADYIVDLDPASSARSSRRSPTVTSEDLATTIAWYSRNIGFTIDQRFESHGTTFVYLTAGDVKIELLAGAPNRGGAPADNILTSMDPSRLHHCCFAVTDVGAAVSRQLELDVL